MSARAASRSSGAGPSSREKPTRGAAAHGAARAHRQGCWWTPSSATSFHAAPAASFNQRCALTPDLESTLPAPTRKIVLQHNPWKADMREICRSLLFAGDGLLLRNGVGFREHILAPLRQPASVS